MKRTHNLGQMLSRRTPLIHNIVKDILRPNSPNNNLVLTLDESPVCQISELTQWHSECTAFFLAHVVVEFGWKHIRDGVELERKGSLTLYWRRG